MARIDHDHHGENAAQVLGHTILCDASQGQGHCWETLDNISSYLADEIACEMIEGGQESCESYLASDGQYYAW